MHTSFARTSQMLTCIYLDFAMHNTCTHIYKHGKHTHMLTRTCTQIFKSRATERLESQLRGRNKSRTTEHPNFYFAGFS